MRNNIYTIYEFRGKRYGGRVVASIAVTAMALAMTIPPTLAGASSKQSMVPFKAALVKEERVPTYTGPTSGPSPATIKAMSGKKITVVECSSANTGCVNLANSIVASDTAVGWTTTIVNGNGSPATEISDMEAAISDGANGIVLDAISSTTVTQGMEAAKAAKIPVVTANSDSPVGSATADSFAEISDQSQQSGKDLADLFIVNSAGTAKVAVFHVSTITSTVNRYDGFMAEFKKCKACSVVSNQTYGVVSQASFESLIKATVAAHPTIQYMFLDISQYATMAADALQQMGLSHKIHVAGIDCLQPETESILRNTGEIGCAEDSLPNVGGPATNEFIRAFAGLPSTPETEPLRLLTKTVIQHSGAYPYLDFTILPAYEKLWGLS